MSEAQTKDFDFDVDDSIYSELIDRFPLLSDLCDADMTEIQQISRVGVNTAGAIKEKALEFSKHNKKANSSDEENQDAGYQGSLFGESQVPFVKKPTKEELEQLRRLREKEAEEEEEEFYILHTQQVDPTYLRRTRIRLNPGVCDECGFDVLRDNGITEYTYETCTSVDQAKIRRALQKHKEVIHSGIARKKIISKSEMMQASNLSSVPSIIS